MEESFLASNEEIRKEIYEEVAQLLCARISFNDAMSMSASERRFFTHKLAEFEERKNRGSNKGTPGISRPSRNRVNAMPPKGKLRR